MSEMRISSEAPLPSSPTRSVPDSGFPSDKTTASRLAPASQDVSKAFYQLGDFLKNALLELHILATGADTAATAQARPAFATAEASHAAQSASAFLQLHEAPQAH
jgi:hypothetical protein